MNNVDDCCKHCRYWLVEMTLDQQGNQLSLLEGMCRRYPPVVDSDGFSNRPTVREDDWCGEYINLEVKGGG